MTNFTFHFFFVGTISKISQSFSQQACFHWKQWCLKHRWIMLTVFLVQKLVPDSDNSVILCFDSTSFISPQSLVYIVVWHITLNFFKYSSDQLQTYCGFYLVQPLFRSSILNCDKLSQEVNQWRNAGYFPLHGLYAWRRNFVVWASSLIF